MNLTPAQNSFEGGEITPLLHNRHDIEAHGKSLAILRNMVVDPRGPVKTRPTTKYYRQIAAVSDAKVITWQVESDKYIIFVIVNALTYIYIRTAGVLTDNTPATIVTPWLSANIHDIHFIADPVNTVGTFFNSSFQPQAATWNGTNITGIVAGVYTAQPWTGNYPATGTIHDQRLMTFRDANIWGTKPGARADFTVGTGLLNDSIITEVDENIGIKWASSVNDLVIGTGRSEHLATSVGSNIYAGDMKVTKQSAVGGKNLQPNILDDALTYVGGAGKKLYATQYSRDVQQWVPQELTYQAEHITESGIKSYAWGPHPNYLCIFSMEDFEFRIMTFTKLNGVAGWSQHQTQGSVKSVASGEINGQAEFIMVAERPVSGGKIFVEITEDEYSLDAYTVEDHTGTPVTQLTGLTQYDGTTVSVITDGAVHPDVAVSGGIVNLDYEAEIIAVGYSFLQEIETLSVDKGSPTGSGRSYTKRFKDIYVGLKNSTVPKINGDYPPDRPVSAPMGSAPPGTTGLVRVSNLGWSLDEPINIQQPLPQFLTLTGIFGELKQAKL